MGENRLSFGGTGIGRILSSRRLVLKTTHSEYIVGETLVSETHVGKWHMSAIRVGDLG